MERYHQAATIRAAALAMFMSPLMEPTGSEEGAARAPAKALAWAHCLEGFLRSALDGLGSGLSTNSLPRK